MISIEDIKRLPEASGVYFFFNKNKEILYIGKATSLKDRVRSYLASDLIETRGRLLVDMVAQAEKVDFLQTDSVLEALILEANLIKKHQPKYNTKEKDNKSFNYVVFTKEDFPRVLVIRERVLEKNYKYIFGPFPNGGQLKEAMRIIRKIFPYRDKCESNQGKPCFNRQLGLCPGVCTGEISKKDYAKQIRHLKLFFEGKKTKLLASLEREMKILAKKQEFEKAAAVRKTIFALNHIQDVALLKKDRKIDGENSFRIEAYDVAHSSGTNVVGVMTVVENGEPKKSDYRKFKIKINPGVNDTGALSEILSRRLTHPEWPFPNLIAVDGAQAQINAAAGVLAKNNLSIPIVSVVKDERHKPKELLGDETLVKQHGRAILLANAEAHRFAVAFHRKKRDTIIP